jgi:hypothetical protein
MAKYASKHIVRYIGGFPKFLHVKFYYGFWNYKMLENVVFHRFLGNKTSTPLNFSAKPIMVGVPKDTLRISLF